MGTLDAIKESNAAGMESPEMERAKQAMRVVLEKANVKPEIIVRAGQLADKALKDPSKTQEAIREAVKTGILEEKFVIPGHEQGLLALAATAGKLAQMIVDEDKR